VVTVSSGVPGQHRARYERHRHQAPDGTGSDSFSQARPCQPAVARACQISQRFRTYPHPVSSDSRAAPLLFNRHIKTGNKQQLFILAGFACTTFAFVFPTGHETTQTARTFFSSLYSSHGAGTPIAWIPASVVNHPVVAI